MPLNKEDETPKTKGPKIQGLVTTHVPQHKHQHIALKKERTKKIKEETADCAQLWAKSMKETKEKCQEQTAKRQSLTAILRLWQRIYF